MRPAVSIVIPIYNTQAYLEQCIQSVLDQTLTNIEVICVDDGSSDASPQIIDHFAAKDKRVIAIHQQNAGYGSAVNHGFKEAQGTYTGIVESDDYIDPYMYQKLFRFSGADQGEPVDIVKGAYWRVCNADTPQEEILPAYYLNHVAHVNEPFTLSQDAEFLFHHPSIWTAIYRTDFLRDRNITMKEVPGAGWVDNPFLMEAYVQARSIVYLDEPLYYYREFNSESSSIVKDPSVIYDRWLDMDNILKDLGETSPKILEGHYARGCAYIEMLNQGFDTNNPQIKSAIKKMVKRMNHRVICKSPKILRNYQDAYLLHVFAPKRLVQKAKRRLSAMYDDLSSSKR